MSLPRYAEYKDSGVAWLGEVPAGWSFLRTKHLFELMKRAPSDQDWIVTAFRDGEVTLRANRRMDGFTNSLQEIGYQGVRRGDLVIHAMDAFAGAIGVSDSDGKSTPVYSVCKPRKGLSDSSYYARLLRHMALSGFVESLAKGIRERSTEFRWAEAGNVYLPVPPIDEQTAIATFLDRETAKIDALIAEQEKLLTLLAEKRQATISHAVTKGLNPDAPMKDSGVEWLGEVPAHWEIKSIRHILDAIGDVDHFMPASVEEGVPYLMTGDLKEFASYVNFADCKQVSYSDYVELSKRIKSSRGDVVMARYATIGTLMYVDIDMDFLVSYSCVTLKTNPSKVSGLYLCHYMKSDAFRQGVENKINTNTQGNVGIKDLQSVKIAVPPIDEQTSIAAFIDSEITKLNALKTESELAIELLKERRTALISAAVTGKIDVRGVAPAQAIEVRECELDAAMAEARTDLAAGRFVEESAAEHLARLDKLA